MAPRWRKKPTQRAASNPNTKDSATQTNEDGGEVTIPNNGTAVQSTSPVRRDLLMALSPELRNEIYSLVLLEYETVWIRTSQKSWRVIEYCLNPLQKWVEPPLLQVSKQIRAEALPLYYGNQPFYCVVYMREFAYLAAWLRSIYNYCGPRPFGHLWISVVGNVWLDIDHILPLVECVRATGLKLRTTVLTAAMKGKLGGRTAMQISRHPWIFEISVGESACHNAVSALHETLDLGQKANSEEWTAEQLEDEFSQWVVEKQTTRPAKDAVWRKRRAVARKALKSR